MVTLARQIIEATPDRIKQEDFSASEAPLRERPANLGLSETMSWLASYLENVDQLPGFSQRRYWHEGGLSGGQGGLSQEHRSLQTLFQAPFQAPGAVPSRGPGPPALPAG